MENVETKENETVASVSFEDRGNGAIHLVASSIDAQNALTAYGLSITKSDMEDIFLVNYPVGDSSIAVSVNFDRDDDRLRFSIDIIQFSKLREDHVEDAIFTLLDLNTEIDPVAVGIETSDPDNPMIQARTALRLGNLQPDEVTSEFEGLIAALPSVHYVVQQFVA